MSASRPEPIAQQPQQRRPGTAPSLGALFIAFLRLGATAFGGPAMVAYIRQMAVDRNGWMNARVFDDGVALCQAVPGATAMQTAAYVGLGVRGVAGAAASFVGFGLPAFVLMLALSAVYARTHDLPRVVSAFSGLQAIVVAIVANAAVTFGLTTLKHWRQALIIGLAVVLYGIGVNPFLVVIAAALLGFCVLKPRTSVPSATAGSRAMSSTTGPVLAMLVVAVLLLAGLFLGHRQLYRLALTMLRIDLFAFGGGFASVPLLFTEVVTTRHWLEGPTLLDGIVLGQVTPGPIVITATFVGYLFHGPLGAAVATLSIFLPSFLIVVAAAPHFDRLRVSPSFTKLIGGALCSFPGLLLIVTVRFAQGVRWDPPHFALAVAAFAALRLRANMLWVVIVGTGLSLLFCR